MSPYLVDHSEVTLKKTNLSHSTTLHKNPFGEFMKFAHNKDSKAFQVFPTTWLAGNLSKLSHLQFLQQRTTKKGVLSLSADMQTLRCQCADRAAVSCGDCGAFSSSLDCNQIRHRRVHFEGGKYK